MHRIIKKTQRGFTLIELMIVVAIIGILAAVAIPQFLKMMAKSKTSEGQLTLDLIKKANKAQWAESTGYVAGTAATLPIAGPGCCAANGGGANNKCTADPDLFGADPVWSALDVKLDQDGYFTYDYTGEADGSAMHAFAYGDLNCNNTVGSFNLEGAKDADGGPDLALAKPGQTTVTTVGTTAVGDPD